MAINQLSSANTFQHWLIATQQLIALANNLTDGGTNSTFVVNTNLQVLGTTRTNTFVANTATVNVATINVSLLNTATINIATVNVATVNVANINTARINVSSINIANINVANITTTRTGIIVFGDDTTLSSNVGLFTGPIAQGAYNKANNAYDKANSVSIFAQGAFDKANTSLIHAQGAFNKANSTDLVVTDGVSAPSTIYPMAISASGTTPKVDTAYLKYSKYVEPALPSVVRTKLSVPELELLDDGTGLGITRDYLFRVKARNLYLYSSSSGSLLSALTVKDGNIGIGFGKDNPQASLDWKDTIVTQNGGSITAIASRTYILSGTVTITLPTPQVGDWVKICNRGTGTSSVVQRASGIKIMGLDENMTIDIRNIPFTLIYSDVDNGWVIF